LKPFDEREKGRDSYSRRIPRPDKHLLDKPQYQKEKHYDDNHSYSDNDEVSRHLHLPSLAPQRSFAPTNAQNSAKAEAPAKDTPARSVYLRLDSLLSTPQGFLGPLAHVPQHLLDGPLKLQAETSRGVRRPGGKALSEKLRKG
jgi:hypothetical protein